MESTSISRLLPPDGPAGIYRLGLSDRKMDLIASEKEVGGIFGVSGPWIGLTPGNSPLIMRSRNLNEIHTFDWEAP